MKKSKFKLIIIAILIYLAAGITLLFLLPKNTYKWVMSFLNFFIVLSVIIVLIKKFLVGFLDKRRQDIVSTLNNADHAQENARLELKEAREKMAGVASATEEIEKYGILTSEMLKNKITSETDAVIERLEKQHSDDIERYEKEAQDKLRSLLVGKAIEDAETRIHNKTVPIDHNKLIDDAISKIEKMEKLPS